MAVKYLTKSRGKCLEFELNKTKNKWKWHRKRKSRNVIQSESQA